MRVLIAFLTLVVSAHATTLKDFNARTPTERSAFVAGYIDKMTTDLRGQNEPLATAIRAWFAVKPEGKPLSEGMEKLMIELAAVEIQAKDGRADLSKIQLEAVINHVVKQKFAPAESARK